MLLACAVALFRLVDWTFLNWGNLRMDDFIITMTSDLSGTNPETFRSALMHTLPFAALAIALAVALSLALRKAPKALSLVRKVTALAAVLVIVGSSAYFFHTIGLEEYVANQNTTSSFIEDHYVDPNDVEITFPEQRRNLIFLFVESMEISFSDAEHGGAKPANVIPELTELGLENEMFSGDPTMLNGGYALYGATSTLRGLFAQTSGLPLTVSPSTLSVTEGFIPGITSLGDVLQDAGYHNYFLLGTDAAFGDRDKYFSAHGDHTIWDFNYSRAAGEIPQDYTRKFWGYDDYILYDNAKAHLLELAEAGEPFNLTMLTVDTHAEDGYICALCEDRFGDDRYSNAFACASRQAYDFVRWCQEQDFYENTTIVIVGDHCTMDHNYGDDIAEDYGRRIYTAFINPAAERQTTGSREYCSMDTFPTVLAALGATIEGDRLGLGTNLFSATPTLTEELGRDELDAELAKNSLFFDDRLGAEEERSVQVAYNDETGCIDIDLLEGINADWQFDYVYGRIAHAEDGHEVMFALTERDGTYHASVPFDEFGCGPGSYTLEVNLAMKDRLAKWFCTEHFQIGEDQISSERMTGSLASTRGDLALRTLRTTPAIEGMSCVATLVQTESGPRIEARITLPDSASLVSVMTPIWSLANGQDDTAWYTAELQDDGTWLVLVNPEKHSLFGIMELDVYGDRGDGRVIQGSVLLDLS